MAPSSQRLEPPKIPGRFKPLDVIAPDAYYSARGYDGNPLRVPSDLDESICRYRELGPADREKFDRALIWLDIASRQWTTSMSASFASLVSAIESLTERGSIHRVYCGECGEDREHDAPGPTAQFRHFFETYAPGLSQAKRRNEMYELRSGIAHGNKLISFDEGLAAGWNNTSEEQRELQSELWGITQIALRNFLRNPSTAKLGAAQSTNARRKLTYREIGLLICGVFGGILIGVALVAGFGGYLAFSSH